MFNTASTQETSAGNSVNVSQKQQFADAVLGQHMLPWWHHTSIDAEPRHGTDNLHSESRWQTQMVFSKAVYSFVVQEDTAPG